jgi:inner membrane protein
MREARMAGLIRLLSSRAQRRTKSSSAARTSAGHSRYATVVLGGLIGLAARWFGRPALGTALIAGGVLVSHAVLDTLTNGGMGCALFWPFDRTRYFAPWNPVPVSSIGLYYFSPSG